MSKYRVVYAATYTGEFTVEAESKADAQDRVIDTVDSDMYVECDDGSRLEFNEGMVTRVDPLADDTGEEP